MSSWHIHCPFQYYESKGPYTWPLAPSFFLCKIGNSVPLVPTAIFQVGASKLQIHRFYWILEIKSPWKKMPKLDLHHWTLGEGGKWGCCNLLKSMGQSDILIPFHLGGKSLKNWRYLGEDISKHLPLVLTWLFSNSPLFLIPLYNFHISAVFTEFCRLCIFRVITWQKIAQYFTQFGRYSVHCSTCWRVPSYLEGISFHSIFWS